MKKSLCAIGVAFAVLVPSAALPQMTSSADYGNGPHGYDWMVGTWSCTNSMPSPMGGPAQTTLTVSKTNGGVIFYRSTGTNFDNSWYNVYVPSKKMWISPFIVSDGSYGTESTSQTGGKIVWVGTAYDGGSGKTMAIRDTNVAGANKYTDLGEARFAGVWKEQYKVTCTRT
jgi:hypothetical protein